MSSQPTLPGSVLHSGMITSVAATRLVVCWCTRHLNPTPAGWSHRNPVSDVGKVSGDEAAILCSPRRSPAPFPLPRLHGPPVDRFANPAIPAKNVPKVIDPSASTPNAVGWRRHGTEASNLDWED